MKSLAFSKTDARHLARCLGAAAALGLTASTTLADDRFNLQIGADNNNFDNPFIQPQDPAESGGGRDQSLQNGDVLFGTRRDDIQIGKLGVDILLGSSGRDVQIGGLEHFTDGPNRSDRAFGGQHQDVFLWKPGDASDFIDGGKHDDAVVLGLVGEPDDKGQPVFEVLNDGQAGEVFLDPHTGLPLVDVTNSPGFCPVIDASFSHDAAEELEALGLDHLVQFVLRGVRNDFENGVQKEDNGLRITLHLKDVEYVVCASRDGGVIEVIDLRKSPPVVESLADIDDHHLRARLEDMVF